jgi:subfamily B ATP-binding cassette protein MsbA
MNLFFRVLAYLRKVWPNVILGIIMLIVYAAFSGLSLSVIYPVIDKIFVVEKADSGEAEQNQASEENIGDIFVAVGQLTTDAFHTLKENWDVQERREVIGAELQALFDNFLVHHSRSLLLQALLVIGFFLFLIKVLSGYFQQIIFRQLEEKVVMWIRNDFYESLLKKPLEFFHRHKAGELISRLTNDILQLKNMTLTSATTILRNALLILVYIGIMVLISWQLALVTLVVAVPLSLVIGVVGRKVRKYGRRVQEKFADLTAIIQEAILNIRIVLAYAMGRYERDKFKKENKKFYKKSVKMVRTSAIASPFSEFMSIVITLFIIGYGGTLVLNPAHALTPGKFFLFLGALLSTLHPVKEISGVYTNINKGLASAERVFSIIDEPATIKDKKDAIPIKELKKSINFNHVSFSYPGSEEVINDITFSIKKGESVALVGPSGGGKSTLMDLLLRFYDPKGGYIAIDGIDIRNYKVDDLRRLTGVVTQETILFDDTIANNIAYGRLDAKFEDIVVAAKAANAYEFILQLEDGYNTVIGERGVKLSGGQRQRIAIARAILKNPQILIFDEATSSLDSESEFLVQEAIARLMKNRTTFVIAHRLSTIRNCNRILVIDKGSILEQGTHEELIAKNGLYKRLYDMQFRDEIEKD